jgi:hypothetical protein
MFITNETARNDLACQMAMASYMERLQREEAQRRAIREGRLQPVQSGNWYISDRH